MNNKNIKLIIVAAVIALIFLNTANAGLISLITKASKAGKGGDIDIPIEKIELPESVGDFTPASIRPNSSGQWDIKLGSGTKLSIDDLARRSDSTGKKPVLILGSIDIPKDFSMFNKIPKSIPIYIKAKNGQIMALKRGNRTALKYKNLRLPVLNTDQLKEGLWHLQRPAFAGPIRLFQLDKDIEKRIQNKVYGSKAVVEKVGGKALFDAMSSLKRQTIVISAPIKNTMLEGISIKQLQKAAADNDINLVIIDSVKPAKLLKSFAKDANAGVRGVNHLYDTTGDFLNKFRDKKNTAPLEVNLSTAGNTQSVIQMKKARQVTETKLSVVSSDAVEVRYIPFHLIAKAITVYRPDVERSKELDRRIVPWLHSDIQFYLITSIVLGLIVFSTSWSLWKKIWSLRERTEYSYVLGFVIIWLIHKLLFIMVFIPIAGYFCFLYAVVKVIVKTINFLLVRPVRWIIAKVVG